MNRKLILALVLLLTLVLGFSCTLDNVTQFMDKMGTNTLGNLVYEVEVKAENQSIDSLKTENPNLGAVLDKLITNMGPSVNPESNVTAIVTPLKEDVKVQLVQNLSSPEGKKKLEEMKSSPADLGATPEEKKATTEAIKGTATIVDSYLQKIPETGTGNADIDKLITSMKTSFESLAAKPESATKGDVLGLQYTVDLLGTVANAIPEDKPLSITVTKQDEFGNPVEVTKKVTSTTLINTLFQNNSNPDEVVNQEELQILMKQEEGQKIIANVAASAQDYVNVVGAATNFTGGVDVSGLLSSFLNSSNNPGTQPVPAPGL